MITLYIMNKPKKKIANYKYLVMDDGCFIDDGKVLHNRDDGWAVLLKKIAEQVIAERTQYVGKKSTY